MAELMGVTELRSVFKDIERPEGDHLGYARSEVEAVYVMHSRACLRTPHQGSLLDCEYSLALDEGIDTERWKDHQDTVVKIEIEDGRLVPVPDN